jgi:nucleotide-binding universal stress UspA family protein
MKLLLAVDESPFSQKAVQSVIADFRPKGTQVQVVNVIEPIGAYFSAEWFPHLTPYTEKVEQEREKQAGALVESVCAKLGKAGFRNSKIVLRGDAREAILDCASEWKPDLIVVGSHGLKGLNRLLMGSVSDAVVRHAPCSVQVVRVTPGTKRDARKPRTSSRKATQSKRR